MKKKPNGFVFVETIVVISIVAVALIMVYRAFSTAVLEEKKRLSFDNPIYLYRTYYVKEFLMNNGLQYYIDALNKPVLNASGVPKVPTEYPQYMQISCLVGIDTSSEPFCNILLNLGENSVLGINKVYVLNKSGKNTTALLDSAAAKDFPREARDYLKAILNETDNSGANISANYYLLLIEFKENCVSVSNTSLKKCDYYYASVRV